MDDVRTLAAAQRRRAEAAADLDQVQARLLLRSGRINAGLSGMGTALAQLGDAFEQAEIEVFWWCA